MLFSISCWAEKTMGVPQYATIRSVKVCAQYSHSAQSCGTGLFVGKNKILTEHHIISDWTKPQIDEHGNISLISEAPKAIRVLKSDQQEFFPAVVYSSSPKQDFAILLIDYLDNEDDVNSTVIFSNKYYRGESVWVVGNPTDKDFELVKTTIVGISHFDYDNGTERDLILLDSKESKIRPGFSGGGVFNTDGGLIGVVELCGNDPDNNTCLAIPSKDAQKYLEDK